MAYERGEPATYFDFYGSTGRRGQHDDGGDQLAQRPYRLAIVAQAFGGQSLLKVLDLLTIAGESRRVKRHGLGGLLRAGKIGFEPLPLGPQLCERFANLRFFGEALYIGLEHTVELAFDPRQALFDARPIGDQPGREPLALFVVSLDIGRDEIGRREIGFQAVEDRALDRIKIIGTAVLAGTSLLHLRTLDALPPFPCVLDGHAGAAAAAFQKTGENTLWLAGVARNRATPLLLERDRLLVEFLVNNPQMRRINGLPL